LMCYASRKGRGCSEEHEPHATWKRSAKDLDWQGCNQRTGWLFEPHHLARRDPTTVYC
jgi:hypothetical protein